jgi:hypothetical protein
MAARPHTNQSANRGATQKDVKNEDWSSEFTENKGANKVVLRVYRKQRS